LVLVLVFLELFLTNMFSPLDMLPPFRRANPVVGVPP